MSVITITITESIEQTIPGIPDTITLSTNIPSIIFFSLDGSIPNTFSNVYVQSISFPSNLLTVNLNLFATDGVNSSAVITKQYDAVKSKIKTNVGARLPHSPTTNVNNSTTNNSLFPFGTSSPSPSFNYLNPSIAGTTIFDQSQPAVPSGFDANGNPAGFINQPSLDISFKQIYSTVNAQGEVLPGVGNLPAKVEIVGKQTAVQFVDEQSSIANKVFDRDAMVIYQNLETDDPTNPVVLNRADFSLEDTASEIVKDGVLHFNTALDSPTTTGSFIRSHYNSRTNTETYYYYDNSVNRWIISSQPFVPTNPNPSKLYDMAPGRNSTKVFQWVVYPRRFLI